MIREAIGFAQFGVFAFWLGGQAADYSRANPVGVLSCLATSSMFVLGVAGILSFLCVVGCVCQEPVSNIKRLKDDWK
jgi:hypothetical protein